MEPRQLSETELQEIAAWADGNYARHGFGQEPIALVHLRSVLAHVAFLKAENVELKRRIQEGERRQRELEANGVSAWGKIGGSVGGKARAAKLSPERRREIGRLAANTRWGNPLPKHFRFGASSKVHLVGKSAEHDGSRWFFAVCRASLMFRDGDECVTAEPVTCQQCLSRSRSLTAGVVPSTTGEVNGK